MIWLNKNEKNKGNFDRNLFMNLVKVDYLRNSKYEGRNWCSSFVYYLFDMVKW